MSEYFNFSIKEKNTTQGRQKKINIINRLNRDVYESIIRKKRRIINTGQ